MKYSLYMDESGAGAKKIGDFTYAAIFGNQSTMHQTLRAFNQNVYPLGWHPGDEVKAHYKSPRLLRRLLVKSFSPDIHTTALAYQNWMFDDLLNQPISTQFRLAFPFLLLVERTLQYIIASDIDKILLSICIDNFASSNKGAYQPLFHAFVSYLKNKYVTLENIEISLRDSRSLLGLQMADFLAAIYSSENHHVPISSKFKTPKIDLLDSFLRLNSVVELFNQEALSKTVNEQNISDNLVQNNTDSANDSTIDYTQEFNEQLDRILKLGQQLTLLTQVGPKSKRVEAHSKFNSMRSQIVNYIRKYLGPDIVTKKRKFSTLIKLIKQNTDTFVKVGEPALEPLRQLIVKVQKDFPVTKAD